MYLVKLDSRAVLEMYRKYLIKLCKKDKPIITATANIKAALCGKIKSIS